MIQWIRRLFASRASAAVAGQTHDQILAQHGLIVFCSKLCIGPERRPVRHAARGESMSVADSGWILSSGDESQAYSRDPKNFVMVPLHLMIETDATLNILREQPIDTELTRKHPNEPWRWILNDKVVDQDGNVIAEL